MRALILFSTFFHFALTISIHRRSVEPTQRIDCFPDAASPYSGYSKEACLARNCLYDDWTPPGAKQCYLSPYYGYVLRESPRVTDKGMQFRLQRNEGVDSMFASPIQNVVLDVQYYTNDILRFKLYDEDNERYEVPIQLNPPSDYISSPQYEFINGSLPANNRLFSFAVKRRDNQATLFDTSLGGLVLNDQFLQIVTRLQSPHVYGLGENNHETLKHKVEEKRTWGIFGRDQGTHWSKNTNHYGSHPFYLVMEQDSDSPANPTGNMHGVLLLNSNAMDYSFEPTPSLTLRTIGGILDFFVFLGPKPEQVVQQYTWLVGRSILPPYWSLGFQLARWDYGNITHMKHVVQRNLDAGIPLDVQYADIDYMDAEKDFTIDPINYPGLKEYFKQLNDEGIRTIVILDPGTIDDQVYYQPTIEGIREDVFIKWDDGQGLMKGACWPGEVFFPDFFTQRAQNWWSRWINDFYRVNLTFDGLWIDMNEPALFDTNDDKPWNSAETLSNHTLKCPKNLLEDPPYRTKAVFGYDDPSVNRVSRLSDRTLCMSALQGEIDRRTGKPKYRHYDVHNLYGWSQTKPSLDAMQKATGKRSLVLPRSTFVGSGQWSGHWLGDNGATWTQMKQSIIGMIEFNWFGIPFNGADICGFDGRPTEEMCIRWMQVGAFYPFSRNHNAWKGPDQDPASWSSYAVNIMTSALRIRYTLLPYYYTLLYKAHTQGSTVIRPLFHEYPTDTATFDISSQFLIGSHIMIVPVTDEGAQIVHAYIPSTHWYNYYTGARIFVQKKTLAIAAPLETIPILLRGGAIIPTQEFANNTKLSRKLPFGLTVVLNASGDAVGDLFYDDGESIDTIRTNSYFYANFTWSSTNGQLIINVIENNYPEMSQLILDSLTIYGLDEVPEIITVDNRTFQPSKRINTEIIEVKGLRLTMGTNYTLSWKTSENPIVQPPSAVTDDPKYRVDCFPDPNANENACRARGCNWDLSQGPGIVACYIPKERGGYELTQGPTQVSDSVTQYSLSRRSSPNASLYGNDIDQLDVQINVSGGDKIRLTIRDANAERYEVPVPIHWNSYAPSESSPVQFHFELTQTRQGQVGFRIRRNNTGSIIFDTSFFAEGFIYDDKYLQFITTTPSRNVYGFGENTHKSFRHILKNSDRYGIFARDQQPYGGNENLYGTHPFYMGIEEDGQAFGVLIFNSNAQDYKFDEFVENQAMLTYRTIGGILDMFFFAGPTPEEVIKQYQTLIGRPIIPPYWALGFQLCRYGYNTLNNMKAAMMRTLNGSIPLDVMYGDIDYFDKRLDFTWDPNNFKGLPEYVDWLHENGMKFITILDPAIDSEEKNYGVYTRGQDKDIWIKWPERRNVQFSETGNRNMLGYVWPDGKTVFPDFFYPPAQEWWQSEIAQYHSKLKFDGLWIDMNEPANFDTNKPRPFNYNRPQDWNLHCPKDEPLETPKYKTAILGDYLSDKTMCMIGEQTDGNGKTFRHYDVHNLYGWSETVASLPAARALENKRSIVISRSTFPTSGAMSGHWLGDNSANWAHLKYNIIGILEFNLFGIPYVGADICGFEGATTEQMCQRWMQLGAFNPFFRNHNGLNYPDHDPGNFRPAVVDSNRRVVETRYTLNPYLYTLFYRVHRSGGTVVRSMAHEFPTIPECWSLDEQFLWGSHLLIAPVIKEGHEHKEVYLPATERWFDYYTGVEYTTFGHITVQARMDYLPLFIRGGVIIPHQQSALNTVLSRKKPFFLVIALDKRGKAQGDLFWDDGESIDTFERSQFNHFIFTCNSQRLLLEPWTFDYPQMDREVKLDEIKIYGMSARPTSITWNGQQLTPSAQWTYDEKTNVLRMKALALDMASSHKFLMN